MKVAYGLSLALLFSSAALAKPGDIGGALTPPGITLQVMGKAQGYDLSKQTAAFNPREQLAFTDAKGMTLYTYDKDPLGQATCAGACADSWRPALAPVGAKTFGEWSVIKRGDGASQWAWRGKALYTFIKDVDPGSVGGNSPARLGARRKNGAGEYVGGGVRGAAARNAAPDVPLAADWRVAYAFPVEDFPAPAGLGVREVADAGALALVDHRGFTLYVFDGDAAKDAKACAKPCAWQPVAAAQLAEPTGDFSLVARTDGVKQWAYKGRGLYTYAHDLAPNDANGAGVDKRRRVAAVYSFFMPKGVQLEKTLSQGVVLATATGKTLYRRDGYIFQSGGGHSLRRGQQARPAVGRDIGTDPRCKADCGKWHPFAAPKDAESQGFWTVAARADGGKQWVYQGYALWTYDGDTRPGDINGNDAIDYAFANQPQVRSEGTLQKAYDIGTPVDGLPALYWAIAVP